MDEYSEARLEAKRDFADFLDSDYGRDTGEGKYVKKVQDLAKKYTASKSIRLDVDVQGEAREAWFDGAAEPPVLPGGGEGNGPVRGSVAACPGVPLPPQHRLLFPTQADLADYNPSLHQRVLDNPGDCIPPFCDALEDMIRNTNPKVGPRLGWIAPVRPGHAGCTGACRSRCSKPLPR